MRHIPVHECVIHKFQMTDEVCRFPLGNVVLVAQQNSYQDFPAVWIERPVDGGSPNTMATQEYRIFGTGHPIDARGLEHVGSAICGPYVWHVYREVFGA